jgi:hypothetical protein
LVEETKGEENKTIAIVFIATRSIYLDYVLLKYIIEPNRDHLPPTAGARLYL